MSTPEKIVQGAAGAALIVFAPSPNLKLLGAALLIGALTPEIKPPELADLQIGAQISGTDPVGDRRVIYGRARVGGVITYMGLHGGRNEYLDLVYTLSGHEVDAIEALYLDNELVSLDGSGNATGKYAGHLHAEFRLGTADQTAIAGLRDSTYPGWLPKKTGLRLDGMGNHTAAAATTAFNLGTMTLEMWVRPLAYQAGTIASLADGAGWRLDYLSDGRIQWKDGAGATITSAVQAPGNWVHIAVTASPSGQTLWINGAGAGSAGAFTNGSSGAQVLRVGALDAANVATFAGDVSDLQIWSVVRTLEEIQSDADNPNNFHEPNRVTYIRFADGAGTVADDTETPEKDHTLYPSWTDDHRQRGCACAWVRLVWNQDLFPGGLPNITFTVRGRKVRDPRLSPDVTAWSANAALCQADYLTNMDFGLGIAASELDDTQLIAAANLADEDVALAAGGTEKRYTVNGSFTTDRTPQSVLTDLFAASQGYLTYVGGKWGIHGGAWRVPTITLTEADFRAPPEIETVVPWRDGCNAVKGVYIDPANHYQPAEMPPVTNGTYQAEDGGERRYLDVSFPFTTSAATAQRLAKIMLERVRQGIIVRARCRLSAFRLQPPDTVYLTWDVMGWSAKPFEVIEGQFAVEGDPPELAYDLVLRETAAAVYTWSAEETAVDPAPNSLLPNPFLVLGPEDLTLESGTAALGIRADGTVFSRIRATWTLPDDAFVISQGRIEVQYRLSGQSPEAAWIQHEFVHGSVTESFILDVIDGEIYDVRIRAINAAGAASAWETVTGHQVIGKTAPPANVTGFSGQQINDTTVTFRWSAVADKDLGGYELRFGPVNGSWETAQPIAVGQSTRITASATVVSVSVFPSIRPAGGALQPWRFYIKAVDTSGNESVSASYFDLVIEPSYDAIFRQGQYPGWPGSKVNLIRNPATGHLNLSSTKKPNQLEWEVFDQYVPSPQASGQYTAPEIDTGGDDRVRLWAEINGFIGAGETGSANFTASVDYRLASDPYDGFEDWNIGEVTARYIQHRVTISSADGIECITEMVAVADLLEHSETATVAVAAGGSDILFTRAYRLPPDVNILSATDGGSPPTTRHPQFAAVTEDGFRAWVLSSAGADVGGQITYQATGI